MEWLTQIPALWRQRLYIAYGALSLLIGGMTAFFLATPDTALPDWLLGAGRVVAYLAIPFALLAGGNVNSADTPKPAPHNPPPSP